ncbi:MAG: acyl-CoA dehydrogenase family protein, partial [Planctomycetes bacterium]|nr:acyl-CoA dehydrogenase family protein [Planctomycetota bacterium]
GSKMWITNGNLADVAIVWAKTGDDSKSVRGFIVETDRPGFSVVEQKMKASLRASVTSELFFEDVVIPAENMLPKAEGLKGPLGCLTQARYGIAWGALGAAAACYHAAKEYAATRIVFDEPLGAFQIPQIKLAKMLTEITKGQLLALQMGRLKDQGKLSHVQVSMGKMNNCEIALDIARNARDLMGANGISLEYPVIRHMCNMESVKTYEGTHDIHNLSIGAEITGIPAFKRTPSGA